MSKIDASFIDDIFGIPQDGSNITEDEGEAYAGADQAASVPFEVKAAELVKEIAAVVPATPKVEEKAAEIPPTKKESVTQPAKKEEAEKAAKAAIPADQNTTTSMFGDIFGDVDVKPATKVEAKVETKKEEPKVEVKAETKVQVAPEPKVEKVEAKVEPKVATVPVTQAVKVDDLGTKAQTQPSQPSAPLMIAGRATQHKWTVNAPSPKYTSFYAAKRDALEGALLKGGELPFDQYFSELEEASVDVTVGEQFNAELVCTKMAECQQLRERTKQIQLRTNRQFFQWERHMDLFAGLLARLEDVRGVDKRDGIRHEHMYDMESYFGELKALHKSIDNVMRVLDSAFECLSRQVTVTMPMKDVERYSTGPKPMTPTLSRFDGLKTQANGSSSVATSRPKEAGTPAESQPKTGWGIVD